VARRAIAVVASFCVLACGEAASPTERDVALVTSPLCAEPGRYAVQGRTVVDRTHGLVWQRTEDFAGRSRADAAAFCAALELDGLSGFRVPAVRDLQDLLLRPIGIADRPDACLPAVDQRAFPDTPPAEHWTATARGDLAVYVDFADGRTHTADPAARFHFRCAR
jgi:hypothetical protein